MHTHYSTCQCTLCAVTICAALTQCELSIPPSWMSPNPQSFPNSPQISAPGLLSPNFGICVFLYNTIYFPVSNCIPLLQVHFTQCTQTKLEDALENQNCTKQSCARFCSASFQRLAYSTDPLLPKARLGFITQARSGVVRLLFVRRQCTVFFPIWLFVLSKGFCEWCARALVPIGEASF